MIRYYEYTDSEGKRWGAMQNTPGGSRKVMNEHLAHLADRGGWKDIEAFPPNMPEHIIKGRINAIQSRNGNPLLYDEEETREPGAKPRIVLITDHAEGEPQPMEHYQIKPTSPAQITTGPIVGLQPKAAIVDHADDPAKPIA